MLFFVCQLTQNPFPPVISSLPAHFPAGTLIYLAPSVPPLLAVWAAPNNFRRPLPQLLTTSNPAFTYVSRISSGSPASVIYLYEALISQIFRGAQTPTLELSAKTYT